MFVDKISSPDIDFRQVSDDSPPVLTSFGTDQTIEIVHHPSTGEPFTVVRDVETEDPDNEDLDKFKELQQQLYEGGAAAPIYEHLLEIDQAYSTCPFKFQAEDGSIYSTYDCASHYYTLAFAAELAGEEDEAISGYYEVWNEFPESPFALMAQQELEQQQDITKISIRIKRAPHEAFMSEHRKEERKKLTSFILVHALPEQLLLGYLADMTLHGAMVVGNRPVEINKVLTLSIDFKEIPGIPDTKLIFPARVAWCKHEALSPYYNTGVEFVELTDPNKKVIEAILERYQFSHEPRG